MSPRRLAAVHRPTPPPRGWLLVVTLVLAQMWVAQVSLAPSAGARPTAGDPTAGTGVAVVAPVDGAVLQPFRPPPHPYGPGHRGVDLAAGPGEAVRSALPGRITFAGPVAGTTWVTVDHGGGLVTTHGPLADPLPAGTPVLAGQRIGVVAATAGTGGRQVTHLDWGARLHGAYLDPLTLLRPWRARLTRPTHESAGTRRRSAPDGGS